MKGSQPMTSKQRQSGFALVAALIVLVLLGTIGGAMVRMTSTEQANASSAILGTRANWAAKTGIEWGVAQISRTGTCATGTLNLTEGALSGFSVQISCTATRHWEGSEQILNLVIRARSSFGAPGTTDHAYREVEATIIL